MNFRLAALSILLASIAAPVPAAPRESRQPTGQWVVDFDAAQCVASRDYGTAEKPLVLALKAPPLGDVVEVVLLRPGGGGHYAEQVKGDFALDDGKPFPLSVLVFAAGDFKQRIIRTVLPVAQVDAAGSASSIRFRASGEIDERLAISQFGPVMKLMDDCVLDLRRVWNVVEGEDSESVLKKRAEGDLRGLFRADDYPQAALQGNHQGSVTMAVLVDEQGQIADCTVIETSGVAILDSQACAVMKERAKFTPAVGPDGQPAKDGHVQRISWKLAR